jgi:hypothetical protein
MWRKSSWCILVAGLGCVLALAGPAYGSGFCPLRGRRPQQRLAGAVVARADDLSAIFYNSADLVQLPGFRIMGSLSLLLHQVEIVTHSGPIATTTPLQGGVEFAPPFFTSIRLQIGCGWGWD